MKSNKYLILFVIICISPVVKAQMGFHNNGMQIKIESGAYVNVVDFTDSTGGGVDGTIDIDGTLIVNGDMTNNTTGNVFTNIETVPNGDIILGGTDQTIQGLTPIFFENLIVKNATKTLSLNKCEVKGIFTVDGVMDLNKNRLILDNGAGGGLTYQTGYLKSETTPGSGLGEIEWKIGSNIDTYTVPFGTGISGGNDLNLKLETKTAAIPSSGSIVFATYPTDINNDPLPPTVSNLDTFKAKNVADRYWKLEPQYTTKPDVVLSFKYATEDVTQANNPDMIEANLEAIRYNDAQNTWVDMKMTGTCNIIDKEVTTPVISGGNFYTWWALSEFELRIPNAFIPQGSNAANAVFLPGYDIKIFNRWDQVLYSGKDGWNGQYKGSAVSPGTYYYQASIPGPNDQMITVKGPITLIAAQ